MRSEAPVYRPYCVRCLKAAATCYCDSIRTVHTRTQFVILQHPRERKKAIGTGRMAQRCLQDAILLRGEAFDSDPTLLRLLADPTLHCVILYPGPRSRNLTRESPEGASALCPEGKRLVLFLIDGTWPEAKKILRLSPNLARLPQVCFTPDRPSEYRIRKQPAAQCVSTIEAIHRVLGLLEPELDTSVLLQLFRSMVDHQIRVQQERSDSYRVAPSP